MKSVLTAGVFAALALSPPSIAFAAATTGTLAPVASAAPGPSDWRTPDPNDVLVIDTNKGRIFLELVPEVAPQFAARVRELTREHFYDGLTFFRVIDDFMAQTGDPKNDGTGASTKPDLPPEFTFRRGEQSPFVLAQDQTVAEVGFIKSMPVMSQTMSLAPLMANGMVPAWPLYCPGVAGAARSDDPNSANSQFFLMRAPYPTLERKYTAFGRVIAGQEVVRALKTGEPVAEPRDRMERVRLLADLPGAERPQVRVIDPNGPWFKAEMARVGPSSGPKYQACDVKIPAEVK